MSDTDTQVPLPDLNNAAAPLSAGDVAYNDDEQVSAHCRRPRGGL